MVREFVIGLCIGLIWSSSLGQERKQTDLPTPEDIKMLIEQEKFQQARDQLLKMPSDFQSSAQAIEMTGDLYGGLKLWDSAMVYYEQLKTIQPNNASGYFKYGGALGMMALSKNKFTALMYLDDIEASFKDAITVDPSYVEAYWALIEYYLKVPGIIGGGPDKAMKQADLLFEISPVDGWMARAKIAEEDEDFSEAEQGYLMAVTQGQSVWAYMGLVSFYERQQRWEEGFQQLKQAMIQLDDLRLNYLWAKLSVLSNMHVQQGLEYIQQCLEKGNSLKNIPEQWVRLRYAQLLRLNGQNGVALDQVNLALALKQDFKEALSEQKILRKLLK